VFDVVVKYVRKARIVSLLKIVSNVRKIAMENMSDLQVAERQPDRNVEANP